MMSFAIGMLRDASKLRNDQPPALPKLTSTQPTDPAELQLIQLMIMRRTRWEQDRPFHLSEAAMLYRTGILLLILGGMLIVIWSAGALWLFTSAREPASPPPSEQT